LNIGYQVFNVVILRKSGLSISSKNQHDKIRINYSIIKDVKVQPGNKDLLFIRLIFNFAHFLMEGGSG